MNRQLTVRETCSLLVISKPTLYRMIRDRQIPFRKIRGQIRFDETELDEWLDEQRISVTTSSDKGEEEG